jgi:hypothetical protein
MIGRTSMHPRRPGGIFEATWIASVQIPGLDQNEPAELLFCFGEGAIGDNGLPSCVRTVAANRTDWSAFETM